jgi:hypothetical protein
MEVDAAFSFEGEQKVSQPLYGAGREVRNNFHFYVLFDTPEQAV